MNKLVYSDLSLMQGIPANQTGTSPANNTFGTHRSNVLPDNSEKYDLVKDFDRNMVDFASMSTWENIVSALNNLNSVNLHIVGSRNRAYHSEGLALSLQNMMKTNSLFYNVFPRSFGLREAIIRKTHDDPISLETIVKRYCK